MRFLDELLIILGLECGYLPDKLAKLFGLMMYHGFMMMVTGGLWSLWLVYKYVRFRRLYRR